jgi:hypothetical protein
MNFDFDCRGRVAVCPGVKAFCDAGCPGVPLRKFTAYSLWYKVLGDAIVVGCLHGKRSPSLAKKRAREIEP